MISSYNNNPMQNENDYQVNSFNGQNQPNQANNGSMNSNTSGFAADYINSVKENRSMYGNYVDNSLTFDPYKEHKSVYNVVYDTDGYNPWGNQNRLTFLKYLCNINYQNNKQ